MKNKAVHWIGVFILICTLSLLVECVFFQREALIHKEKPIHINGKDIALNGDYSVTFKEDLAKLTEDEQNAIKVQRENEKLIAEYKGEVYEPEEDEFLVEKGDTFYRKVIRTTIQIKLDSKYYIRKLKLSIPLEENG